MQDEDEDEDEDEEEGKDLGAANTFIAEAMLEGQTQAARKVERPR